MSSDGPVRFHNDGRSYLAKADQVHDIQPTSGSILINEHGAEDTAINMMKRQGYNASNPDEFVDDLVDFFGTAEPLKKLSEEEKEKVVNSFDPSALDKVLKGIICPACENVVCSPSVVVKKQPKKIASTLGLFENPVAGIKIGEDVVNMLRNPEKIESYATGIKVEDDEMFCTNKGQLIHNF